MREFEEKGISGVDFSKKLLGQVVFLYFLQKKGWLGVKRDPNSGEFFKWGTGSKTFVRELFNGKVVQYKNFFNDILEPLFYEALATQRDNDYYSRFDCKIPFLDGGLFEPIGDYNWTYAKVPLDNKIFGNILDTFDRFNFTVKEDEPLEKEVAVDPEMLGKVFENMLEVKDRKSKGTYYTPREIVHYMCQQCIINYLETNTKILREEIETFINIDNSEDLPKSIKDDYSHIDQLLKDVKIVDPAVGSGAFPVGIMAEVVKARNLLTAFFDTDTVEKRTNYFLKRETVENSLYGVDIDPSAIEIAKLRFWLSLVVDEDDLNNVKPLPNLDHKLMVGNSLVEEFNGIKLFDDRLLGTGLTDVNQKLNKLDNQIHELKIEKGQIAAGKKKGDIVKIDNHISSLKRKIENLKNNMNEVRTQYKFDENVSIRESQKKFYELKRLQKQFFNAKSRADKNEYKVQIDKIEWELIEETIKEQGNGGTTKELEQFKRNKSKPFFLWKLYFFEVFQRENPGFDILIANPPYVRIQSIDENTKSQYLSKFLSAKGKFDLYVLFTELGINILRNNGSLSYIMPNKFTNTNYGIELRKFILSKTIIQSYVDFSDKGVFEGQTNYPCIILLKKLINPNNIIRYVHVKQISPTLTNSLSIETDKKRFENEDVKAFVISQKELTQENWTFVQSQILDILKKLNSAEYGSLADYRDKIYEGLITGNNEVYLVNNETIKKYNLERQLLRKLPKGKNIHNYFLVWDDYYVIYPYLQENGETKLVNINNYPNIKNYFENYKSKLAKRDYLTKAGKKWYEIWNPRTIDVFATQKIITPNLSKSNRFALDYTSDNEDFMCIDHDCYAIILKEKNLTNYKLFTAILNNPVVDFIVKNISPMFSGGFYKYHTQYLDKVPIPKQFSNSVKVVQLVDQILVKMEDDNYFKSSEKQAEVMKLEKEVDQLIYKSYKLSSDEIKIIEEFCNNR